MTHTHMHFIIWWPTNMQRQRFTRLSSFRVQLVGCCWSHPTTSCLTPTGWTPWSRPTAARSTASCVPWRRCSLPPSTRRSPIPRSERPFQSKNQKLTLRFGLLSSAVFQLCGTAEKLGTLFFFLTPGSPVTVSVLLAAAPMSDPTSSQLIDSLPLVHQNRKRQQLQQG